MEILIIILLSLISVFILHLFASKLGDARLKEFYIFYLQSPFFAWYLLSLSLLAMMVFFICYLGIYNTLIK